jgi:hypothetical protein
MSQINNNLKILFCSLINLKADQESIMKVSTLLDDAIEYFGTTYDFNEAGYILPDGKLLDLSEKKRGAEGGQRTEDHRAVSRFIEEPTETLTDAMDLFMKRTGAIRISLFGDYGLIDLETKPTTEQLSVIQRLIQKRRSIDISMPGKSDVEEYDLDIDSMAKVKIMHKLKNM